MDTEMDTEMEMDMDMDMLGRSVDTENGRKPDV